MSALRLDGTGAGAGTHGRADFNGAEHLDKLVPGRRLDVDTGGIPQPKNRTETPTGRRRTGWQRQESLVSQHGDQSRQFGSDWNRFSGSGGRGRNLGSVAIDHPGATGVDDGPPPTFTPDQLKKGMWVEQAAHFEETQRETEGKYGSAHGVGLPSIDVDESPPRNGPGNPKNRRRAFSVG